VAIAQITDHSAQAQARLLQQFQDRVTMPALAAVVGGRAQAMENALWAILTQRFFSGNPIGQQLDNLGKLLNILRNGMSDATYTRFLKGQVLANMSNGTVSDLETLLGIISDVGSNIVIAEYFPAGVEARVGGVAQTQALALAAMLQAAKAAGVKTELIYNTDTDANSFALSSSAQFLSNAVDVGNKLLYVGSSTWSPASIIIDEGTAIAETRTISSSFAGVLTNLILQSQTFDNASWSKVASSIIPNAVAAPDGTTTADRLLEDSTNAQHRMDQTSGIATGVCVFSVWAKASGRTQIQMRIANSGAIFDLTTGVASGVTGGYTAGSDAWSGGWWRCWIAGACAASDIMRLNLINAGSGTYLGDGVSGVYFWGAQLEQTSVANPAPYSVTTSSTVVTTTPFTGVIMTTGMVSVHAINTAVRVSTEPTGAGIDANAVTTLGSSPGSGASSLLVGSTTGFSGSGTIIIAKGTVNEETIAYSSVDATHFNLVGVTVLAHTTGDLIQSSSPVGGKLTGVY
jgi:hypothetical protein